MTRATSGMDHEGPKVSPTCEHLTGWRANQPSYCGNPTLYWYPAQRAGTTMALCAAHAKPMMAPAFGLRPYTEKVPA